MDSATGLHKPVGHINLPGCTDGRANVFSTFGSFSSLFGRAATPSSSPRRPGHTKGGTDTVDDTNEHVRPTNLRTIVPKEL